MVVVGCYLKFSVVLVIFFLLINLEVGWNIVEFDVWVLICWNDGNCFGWCFLFGNGVDILIFVIEEGICGYGCKVVVGDCDMLCLIVGLVFWWY